MPEFRPSELKLYERLGIITAAVGLLVALITKLPHDPDSFWHEAITGLHGTAWVTFGAALVWTALAAAHRRTGFFSLNQRMDANAFGISMGAIAVATIVALVVLTKVIPSTPRDRLPGNQKARVSIMRKESTVRAVVCGAVLLTAGIMASYPIRKFLKP